MGTLTDDMKRIVAEQKLGFVATVDADGSPNLAPKATMLVLDDGHVMFGDIRSPNTIANVRERPAMEINFVDAFVRKGYRFKGRARYAERGSAEFEALLPRFEQWGALCDRFRGIVILAVERAAAVTSPAYDDGATESELRAHWSKYFADLGG